MGRPKRAAHGGLVYHVLNRSNAKMPIFEKDGDYEAFERVLEEAVARSEARLLAYCVLRTGRNQGQVLTCNFSEGTQVRQSETKS